MYNAGCAKQQKSLHNFPACMQRMCIWISVLRRCLIEAYRAYTVRFFVTVIREVHFLFPKQHQHSVDME